MIRNEGWIPMIDRDASTPMQYLHHTIHSPFKNDKLFLFHDSEIIDNIPVAVLFASVDNGISRTNLLWGSHNKHLWEPMCMRKGGARIYIYLINFYTTISVFFNISRPISSIVTHSQHPRRNYPCLPYKLAKFCRFHSPLANEVREERTLTQAPMIHTVSDNDVKHVKSFSPVLIVSSALKFYFPSWINSELDGASNISVFES